MTSIAAGEEPTLSFVRNNPFVQNDLATTAKRHYPSSSSTSRLPNAPPIVPAPTVVVVRDRSHESAGAATPSEIEYGPGIVRKLREKFSQLADSASKDANISVYSRHKRFPSVDDLISDELPSKIEEKRLSREHSKSIGSLAELEEQDRQDLYNLRSGASAVGADRSRHADRSHPADHSHHHHHADDEPSSPMPVESAPTLPLSILRQKFENSAGGVANKPKRNSKLIGLIIDRRAQNHKLNEPEFVAVSKKLRHVETPKATDSQEDSASEETILPRRNALRSVETDDRVVPEKDAKLIVDVSSPPDPAVNGHVKDNYAKFVPDRHHDVTDRSPPPEEPRPPAFDDNYQRSTEQPQSAAEDDEDGGSELSSDDETSYDVSPAKVSSTTSAVFNDASGIGEMQQLLNKFNSIRERKTSEDDLGALTVVQPEKPPLVSVAGAKLPVAPHSNGHTTLIEITAEESPKRKSLSAQFLESKQKQAQQQPTTVAEEKEETNGEEQSRQVHIEHVDQHPPVEVAHHPSDLYPPEITAIDYDRFAHSVHEQVQIAGDGNPVRHSLLSLVSEEDVPLLLEAMAERFHFVFEDLINNNNNIDDSKTGAFLARPTASNLVKRGQPRRVDAKKNGVNGVVFATEPPSAFAYLDENGAVESDEWIEGTRISFDDYQRLCAEEREDYANKRLELLKWQASLISQQDVGSGHTPLVNGGLTAFVPSQLSSTEYELGVTNRFSYGDGSSVSASTNAQKNQPDRPSAVLGHSGDDSVEFRPINQEADSFSQVENASDLLF